MSPSRMTKFLRKLDPNRIPITRLILENELKIRQAKPSQVKKKSCFQEKALAQLRTSY